MSNETFGQYLERRQMELGHQRGKRYSVREMAKHIEKKLANPLVQISQEKLSRWRMDKAEPNEALKGMIRKALGDDKTQDA